MDERTKIGIVIFLVVVAIVGALATYGWMTGAWEQPPVGQAGQGKE